MSRKLTDAAQMKQDHTVTDNKKSIAHKNMVNMNIMVKSTI